MSVAHHSEILVRNSDAVENFHKTFQFHMGVVMMLMGEGEVTIGAQAALFL